MFTNVQLYTVVCWLQSEWTGPESTHGSSTHYRPVQRSEGIHDGGRRLLTQPYRKDKCNIGIVKWKCLFN